MIEEADDRLHGGGLGQENVGGEENSDRRMREFHDAVAILAVVEVVRGAGDGGVKSAGLLEKVLDGTVSAADVKEDDLELGKDGLPAQALPELFKGELFIEDADENRGQWRRRCLQFAELWIQRVPVDVLDRDCDV